MQCAWVRAVNVRKTGIGSGPHTLNRTAAPRRRRAVQASGQTAYTQLRAVNIVGEDVSYFPALTPSTGLSSAGLGVTTVEKDHSLALPPQEDVPVYSLAFP